MRLLRRDSNSKALADFAGKLDHAVLIPAGERAELTIDTEYSCATIDAAGHETQRDESTCFNDAFGDTTGFVALDDESKTRLNLPKPALATGKKANGQEKKAEGKASPLLAPDRGDIFDRVAACEEADRLVSLCRRQNFKLPKDSFVPDTLRDLPQPPKGFKLDPSVDTCELAGEWQNYCRVHNK